MAKTETPEFDIDAAEEVPSEDMIERIADEERTAAAALSPHPMFATLLRAAVAKAAPGDMVLADYVRLVAEPLSDELALTIAKGGEEFIADRLAAGKTAADVERYKAQQSLRAHLVNGLFPAARIARQLQAWGAPRFGRFDDRVYRLFCAGYTLHDWLKLPEIEARLKAVGLSHDTVNAARHLPLLEEIFREWGRRLQLDEFLDDMGGLEPWLHDLIYIAVNTQVRWGTMRVLSELPRLNLGGRERQLATDLSTLADRIAYIAKTPRDVVTERSIAEPLADLSDSQARLICHHVAENRGVLTNFIHNAALASMETPYCVPLLYAPSGVVYLAWLPGGPLPNPSPAAVAEDVVARIKEACGAHLRNHLTGFSRDGKGLKYAGYYALHFDAAERIQVAAKAAFKRIPDSKTPAAGGRFDKMREKGMALPETDLALPVDIRVDQLAEFCAMAESIAEEAAPGVDATDILLRELGLEAHRPAFDQIARYPQAGGVAYNWYYAAGAYLKHGAGQGRSPAEWQELIEGLASSLADRLRAAAIRGAASASDGWEDLRAYVASALSFSHTAASANRPDPRQAVQVELARYSMAKAQGRGVTAVCSLCSSSYTVGPQQEAGILFAPQVYSNKQPLHGSKAIRNICRVCEIEMMLRQILMNRQAVAGGRFEGRRVRYIFFYPTYFFTPETLAQMEDAYNFLKHISFTSLRRALLADQEHPPRLRLDPADLQRLDPLLLTPVSVDPAADRLFRLRFPAGEPVTFFFLGVPPPGREAKDAEAWINPAFLALLLPLALDVKVVASESSLPLLTEANELDEAVFFDAAHDFVKDIVGRERIPLEGLLDRLRALTVAYFIHLDANANFKKGDYRWHAIPPLARNLAANSLWTFAYLKKWQRRENLDSIPADKANLYIQYARILDQLKGADSMSHARELTTRYMRFYRAARRNQNSHLRPVSIVAETILAADPRMYPDADSLVELVRGELKIFMDRVGTSRADGHFAPGSDGPSREAAIADFARYFVEAIFLGALRGDKAALRGKQLNLLKNACEVIYVDATEQERRERQASAGTQPTAEIEEE